jgi:opacity protein-like surface antigen
MSTRTLTRFLIAGAATVALVAVSTPDAAAQGEPTPVPQSELPACPPDQANLPACPPAPVMTPPPPPMATAPTPHKRHHNIVFAPSEISLVTGAGPTNYFGTGLNASRTDVGAVWDARVTFGAHSILALEAGYVGSVNNIDSNNGVQGQIYSNGLDGDLRLQFPTRVQPYIFGGVGYNRMEVNRQGSPDIGSQFVSTGDNQVTIPAGGGVTGYVGKHMTVDLRGTYRLMPDNNITIMDTHAIHQWYAQARVGYAF